MYLSVILPLKLDWEPCYRLPEGARPLRPGERVCVLFARKKYTAVVSAVDIAPETDPARIHDVLETDTGLPPVSEEEIGLWRRLADYYLCSVGEVYKVAYPPLKTALENAGAAARQRRGERDRKLRAALEERRSRYEAELAGRRERLSRTRPGTKAAETLEKSIARLTASLQTLHGQLDAPQPGPAEAEGVSLRKEIRLSPAQEEAARHIKEGFRARKTVLLDGVTGSGKTEIYLTLAAETLRRGRSVLYLVPEIALSRQLEDRLKDSFGPGVLVFHSAETPVRRREVAEKVRKGASLVLGTRSALFLPHRQLGLVIVDEEHDSSYKQEAPAPRYQARDAAILLAALHGAAVLLGSATPSLESLYNCATGKYRRVCLSERYFGAGEARMEIIDTRAERRKGGMHGAFSRPLIRRVKEVLGEGGQVMLLRARRAYASAVQCPSCGHIPACPRCNVPLALHKDGETLRLLCHHCGHSEAFPERCPQCGKDSMVPLGSGTQRVEEEARALFPEARIGRLDADTPRTQEAELIRAFSTGEINLLIGTQMLTKGFDFSGLTLVAVLQADSLLGVESFRADERAAQLLSQLQGRCGRRGQEGWFLIQTALPDHPVYRRFSPGGAETFRNAMLEERRQLHFPPWTRQTDVILRDANPTRLDTLARALAQRLGSGYGLLSGPCSPVVDRVAGEHIRIIRLLMERDRSLAARKKALAETVARFEKERSYTGHIFLDVDPA